LRFKTAKTCVDVNFGGCVSEKRTYGWNGIAGRRDEEINQAITKEKARKTIMPETFSKGQYRHHQNHEIK